MNLSDLFDLGEMGKRQAHKDAEVLKVGGLRGGSTGALLYGKTPVGQCARKAYLRFKGVDLNDVEENRHLMFDAGVRNEDSWADNISRGLELARHKNVTLRREEEIGVNWSLPNGTGVSGRPDIVLFDENGPLIGIELKLVCSIWTARDVIFHGEPKISHLLQAGHYLKQMSLGQFRGAKGQTYPNLEWEIYYTSHVDWPVPMGGFMGNLFKDIIPGYMEWRDDAKTGKPYPLKILPFKLGFRVKWNDRGQLLYQRIPNAIHPLPSADVWEHTVITWESIQNFFSLVSDTDASGTLPPRPANVSAKGEKGGYSMCDKKYCVVSATCDRHENNLSAWLEKAKVLAQDSDT